MKFAVGEGAGGAVAFSDDSGWAALTVSPMRREAQANTRARRPNQTSVTIVNLATGDKVSVPKIRRFAFAESRAAGSRSIATGPRRQVAPQRRRREPVGVAVAAAVVRARRLMRHATRARAAPT